MDSGAGIMTIIEPWPLHEYVQWRANGRTHYGYASEVRWHYQCGIGRLRALVHVEELPDPAWLPVDVLEESR